MTTSSIRETTIYIGGANRAFDDLTLDDVRSRADELREVTGWGPTARIAPVARAWRELSILMERAQVATVAGLPDDTVTEMAAKLWVTPAGGTLLP
jgi:hypothetical protein